MTFFLHLLKELFHHNEIIDNLLGSFFLVYNVKPKLLLFTREISFNNNLYVL